MALDQLSSDLKVVVVVLVVGHGCALANATP